MGTLKVVKKDEVKVQSLKKSFLKHYCRHANTLASQRDYNVSANGYMLMAMCQCAQARHGPDIRQRGGDERPLELTRYQYTLYLTSPSKQVTYPIILYKDTYQKKIQANRRWLRGPSNGNGNYHKI